MATVRIAGTDYPVNANGVIDLTERYNVEQYMTGGPAAWQIQSPMPSVVARIVHHWAGEFISGDEHTHEDALAEIDACARFHRAGWGIGPGYNVIVAETGVYAVGKHGTHRAHTKGRNPNSGAPWNVVGRSVALIGNFETETLTPTLKLNLPKALAELQSWPNTIANAPIYPHGEIPTVNSAGVALSQGTLCPGRNVKAWLAGGGPSQPAPVPTPPGTGPTGSTATAFRNGWRLGYSEGRFDALSAITSAAADQRDEPIPTPPTPSG